MKIAQRFFYKDRGKSIELLIKNGANPDASTREDGWTALQIAAQMGNSMQKYL